MMGLSGSQDLPFTTCWPLTSLYHFIYRTFHIGYIPGYIPSQCQWHCPCYNHLSLIQITALTCLVILSRSSKFFFCVCANCFFDSSGLCTELLRPHFQVEFSSSQDPFSHTSLIQFHSFHQTPLLEVNALTPSPFSNVSDPPPTHPSVPGCPFNCYATSNIHYVAGQEKPHM